MFKEKKFSILVLVCAALLVVPSVSYAKNIIVSDAQNYVRYEFDGNSNAGGAIATLRELFAQVVESGDVVYIGENWDTGDVDGNGEVDETWETTTWLARFIITEPIEISKDVAIYASCPGRRLDNETIEVQPTTEADMTDDLTTFEGKSSQIFIIRNGAKVKIANLRITGAYGGSDSSGGAIYVSEGSHAEITNCIIKDSARNNYSRGGAIYVNASTLTLKSSDIINNYSNYRGGGIAIENGSYASITNCTITSNDSPASGHGGGGIYILSSSADITDSVITKNTTSLGDGGGVCIVGSSTTGISSVTLTNCTISDNTCQYEGGGIDVFYATAAIKNCIISGNTCTGFTYSDGSHHHGNGGGIYVYQPQESLTITDCIITGNSAYHSGGGIDFDSSYTITPIATNCLIANNTAYNYGGGIDSQATTEINNCTIISNEVFGYTTTDGTNWYGYGGGVYVSSGVLMTNSTVTKNSAASGGGIYFVGDSGMLSNCSIVDNSAVNGGIEIQRDGGVQIYRIPFINSLIFNTTSPDKAINNPDADTIYDRSRMLFFNCAVPETLALPERSPSFDIVQIASWNNPVSSNLEVNGITHTVYRIEDNPALKPLVGSGANRIVYSNSYYTRDIDYTSPEYDQLGTARVNSPDIGAVEKAITKPVLSADANIEVVENSAIADLTISDTEPNKALAWTTSGDLPSGIAGTADSNGMTYTLSGAPTQWGDYDFSVIATNTAGSNDVKVSMIVYTAPVLSDEVKIEAVRAQEFSQTFPAISGNHLAWTTSETLPDGLELLSDDTSFTISGTPTVSGDYECSLKAENLAGSDDVKVSMIIYAQPVLSVSSVNIDVSKDKAITVQTITATEGNHLAWSTSGTIPDGITVASSDNTTTISGTPTTAGNYEFSIYAGNYAGSADATVSVTVYSEPALSNSALTIRANENEAMTHTISVNSGNYLTWTKAGNIPDGITITSSDSSVIISGTPTTAGSFEFSVKASNYAGDASTTINMIVYAKPVLSDTAISIDVSKDQAITSRTITATSGNYLTWSTEGNIPAGITVSSSDATITIGGNPTTVGSYDFSVIATNNAGSASTAISISVTGAPEEPDEEKAPVLSISSQTVNLTAGTAMTALTITASEGDNLRWTTSGDLPSGVTGLEASDHRSFTISGTPDVSTAGQNFTYTVTATNSIGSADAVISLNVAATITAENISSMTAEEKAQVTNLNLTGFVEGDLSALLEGFTNLETLDLSETEISNGEINLDNVAVENISINGNASVKSVNISSNNTIKIIEANGCEELDEVNIENCDELVSLDIAEANTTSLNIKNCKNLKTVKFERNGILVFDFNAEDLPSLETLGCAGQARGGLEFSRTMTFNELLNSAEVSVAADVYLAGSQKVTNVKGYDASGNEIAQTAPYDGTTGTMSFASTPAIIRYDYDTGFNNQLMDVTISGTGNDDNDKNLGSSGGGCDVGLGASVLSALAALFLKLKRK